MKLSLIIVTYNKPVYLEKVLEAVRIQTERPDEVLIADDGSGPETGALIDEWRRSLPCPLLHVWHEDKGFRAAKIRNEAIKKSSGDYIVILDGDCVPERHFVSDHASLARKKFFFQGKRLLLGKRISGSFDPSMAARKSYLFRLFLDGEIKNSHHLLRMSFLPAFRDGRLKGTRSCNMGFFRDDLIAVNGFNEDFTGWGREDSELVARLYRYGLKRETHPFMALCFHLWHEENDKSRLEINEKILSGVLAGRQYRCKNGITRQEI
ncbi:MAG: glycosyltransferase family 2 protein [Nitrospiraceae bacterium]|nr:glycosyltransferase family 2 protein [Nitrospiraceae bacterium]